jgi:hypothetical protein
VTAVKADVKVANGPASAQNGRVAVEE